MVVGSSSSSRRGRIVLSAVAVLLVGSMLAITPPVQAAAPAGGTSTGTINYVGEPLPPAFRACARDLHFTLGTADDPDGGWVSDAFVVSTGTTTYAGPVRITGGGGSDGRQNCENYSSGAGVFTLAVSGTNPLTGDTLACNDEAGDPTRSRPFFGRYIRLSSALQAIVSGNCLVNGTPTGAVTFVVEMHAVPADAAEGEAVTTPVRSLVTTGAWVRPPA
jgi:hypothetical protein